jgi:homeobox-leucine zipper protein
MELALSLGDSPKPYAFLDKTTKISNKDLGFCMGLGSGSGGRSDEKTDSRDGEGRRREVIRDEGERRRVSSDPPLQLELLPFSPVPRSQPPTQLRFPWLTDNCKYPLPPPHINAFFFLFFFI